jgi:nicotinamide-nucleotide adenylyltransferase
MSGRAAAAGPRRALCAWELQQLHDGHLEVLAALEEDHDELVVVVTEADEAYTPDHLLPAGERIAGAMPVLRAALRKPFYLLPIKRDRLSAARYVTRIRLGCPRFHTVACATAEERRIVRGVLRCRTRLMPVRPTGADRVTRRPTARVRRGLFVTRAQFFHVGHRAFVRQIAAEMDEVIVLVAMANASHTSENPATAGERLEMIGPLLRREAPGRHYLCAAPYVDDDGANFAELALMLPRFDVVYANSPSTAAMARSDGYRTRRLANGVDASGTEVRRRIVAGEDHEALLPPEVARALRHSPALQRLRDLARREPR